MRMRERLGYIKEPSHIGGRSPKDIARLGVHENQQDGRFSRAAQLTHDFFLALLFPFFLFLTTLLGYLPVPNLVERPVELLA